MKLVRVGAAVLNQTPLDWQRNTANIVACLKEARERGVSILCLPELCLTGYGCEDAFLSRGLHEEALRALQEILPATEGMVVSVGLPLFYRHAVLNTACLVAGGRVLGFVAKQHLAGDGIHYEPRWFKEWPSGRHASIEIGGESLPIGELRFAVGGVTIGFEICEDAWVARRPGADLASRGVDIIMNPSASHFAFGKHAIRERLVIEGSRAFGVSYLYANLLGNEAGRIIYDGGALIASGGGIVARGPRFSFADYQLTTAVVDVDATRLCQARTASFQPDFAGNGDDCVRVGFDYPALEPPAPTRREPSGARSWSWEASTHLKEEEFTRAVALGLFDYLRKSRSAGLVVSLSGGCDSSVVATISALMVELAASELGLQSLLDKLGHVERIRDARSVREIVAGLLSCVYQATSNSSAVTRNAARTVAQAIGAEYLEFDVDQLVASYTEMVSTAVGRPLEWATDDLALQNIQARVRAPGIWMLANLRNALLLATSNRSEAAVGYATMDGDTCGGLSPIAGIDKAFLRNYIRWLEEHGPAEIGSIPALSTVTRQIPTAELRPPQYKQADETDLMPYDVLDAIERAAIRDRQVPVEVYRRMRSAFPAIASHLLGTWVERFFRLWCRNQWKRERYAPSFHLDDENLDPKTWCRFPILSGGFDRELADLRAYLVTPN
ncbi:MAG: NAD(+) synthase [Pseudomonadota bacterium]